MSLVNETPTLAHVIQTALKRFQTELHTCLPAEIVTYDRTKQKASVQPLLQRKTKDGVAFNFPVITNVPCRFERTSKFSITYELKPKDTGIIIVSERSLDVWLNKGGLVDPNDLRKHDINDAIFFPGLFPFSTPAPAEANVALIQNDKTRFRLYENGKMAFTNLNSNEELVKVLSDLCQALISALTTTAIGPQPFTPSTISALTSVKSRLDTLKE